jgi:hypothetical protein
MHCSPDGETLVSGSDDGTMSLLHVASGKLISQIQCQQFGQVAATAALPAQAIMIVTRL